MKTLSKTPLMSILIAIISISFSMHAQERSQYVINKGDVLYASNELIMKVKHLESRTKQSATLSQDLLSELTFLDVESITPTIQFSQTSRSQDLMQIVSVKYNADIDPMEASGKLKRSKNIYWVEPRFVYEVGLIPDDPKFEDQYYLSRIAAEDAWDISTGDTSVVIAIIDTGVDWDHPDLEANIWHNWAEIPNNGVDDDENGYVDDHIGWDFGGLDGTPDNDPVEDNAYHGTHVAGCAAAVTNNGEGVASIGFNSRIMCVKTAREDMKNDHGTVYIYYGNEGVVYAADNGADVVNMSYGGSGYSEYSFDVMQYAYSKGVVLVGAAGNENSSLPHYPSGYDNVLSVAASDQDDIRASFSNYGYTVDVLAPGVSIYNTWFDDTYAWLQGTSMASPIVAGLAALVKAQFPNYTPNQIAEQIRVTSDNTDPVNGQYIGRLGYGRINAYYALTETEKKSARITMLEILDSDGGDGDAIYESGETLNVYFEVSNYLNPTNSLQITLETTNPNVTIQNSTFSAGAMATLESLNNGTQPLTVSISNDAGSNVTAEFKLSITDGDYTDMQLFSIPINPTYGNFEGNEIAFTVTSRGNFGFNDFDANEQGIGFRYEDGENLIFEGALIFGTDADRISNAARDEDQISQDADFVQVKAFTTTIPGEKADTEGHTIYSDNNADNPLGINTELTTYAWASEEDDNYIILSLRFHNTTDQVISNFFAGLFFDWDLLDYTADVAQWDEAGKFGYVYNNSQQPITHIGMGLISDDSFGFRGIVADGSDEWGIYDGFTDDEKWTAISGGISKASAGPNDISAVISGGPYAIPENDYVDVAFVLAAGDNTDQLTTAVINAKSKWDNVITGVENNEVNVPIAYSLDQNFPNPFNPSTSINFSVAELSHVSLKIFDILGREIKVLADEVLSPGYYTRIFNAGSLSSGVYFYEMKADGFSKRMKMMLVK